MKSSVDRNWLGCLCSLAVVAYAAAVYAEPGAQCGGFVGIPCEEGEYCETAPGECCCDFFGTCTTIPEVCEAVFDPVCGCDGQTYGNPCEADAAGVSINYEGECAVVVELCGGFAGLTCSDPDDFCLFPDGQCCCDQFGVCTETPAGCPEILDPVCGCDGQTYTNRCEAHAAGVSVDHEGPCDVPPVFCGDIFGAPFTCPDGQYCMTETGDCHGIGECTFIPVICPLFAMPVCGCDGMTYINPCFAALAGVSVEHVGACEDQQPCGTGLGAPACPEGQYCMTDAGDCDGIGTCAAQPEICPLFFDPVCGCDGETYGNACEAAAAGTSVDHSGPCDLEQICGIILGSALDCPDGQYCQFPDGECDALVGTCEDVPEGCLAVFDPVCGCDGMTYGNACEAAAAGVSIDHAGPCEGPGLCESDDDCGAEQYCHTPSGDCDATGICTDIPTGFCAAVFAPVCGCDGVTYDNECLAALAGVSVDHLGPCDERQVCSDEVPLPPCPEGSFCQTLDGACDALFGFCEPMPFICPLIFDPVCGCDGMTYGNECLAAAEGVSIDHDGECDDEPNICGTIVGIPCEEGEYCMTPTGECCCDIAGTCQPIPEICPAIFNPVCGCDGETYGNPCLAAAAGVSIEHAGPCNDEPQMCGGLLGLPCDDGEYCMTPTGLCCCDIPGVCAPIPELCPAIFAPVCGCDGQTYGNACEAAAAGVSVDHDGPCEIEQICGTVLGSPLDCPPDQYCMFPNGDCDALTGVCREFPEVCPLIFDPVCGCDGETYSNPCFAASAGVSIDHEGACNDPPEFCGGIAGFPCPNGQFCQTPPGQCCCDIPGVCTDIPDLCPLVFAPVCGCDGQTYDNPCFAASAGVSIDHTGPCDIEPQVCGGFAGIQCDEGEFCKLPDGMCCCDIQGVCQPIPEICPLLFLPVCGCDGVTYDNECEAAMASVSVDFVGICELACENHGDFDGDQDVDLTDFSSFQLCYSGAGFAILPGCECADFDGDGDCDLTDFAGFQLSFTGRSAE